MPNRSEGDWSSALAQAASVARVGQLGLGGLPLADLFDEALEELATLLGVTDVALFEKRPSRELRGRAGRLGGGPLPPEVLGQVRVPISSTSMVGYAAELGERLVVDDLSADRRFEVQAADYGIQAAAAVVAPIGDRRRGLWGVLVAYSPVPRHWTEDEVQFVQNLATTVGLAAARQRSEDELKDSTARLELSLAAGSLGTWSWDLLTDEVQLSPQAREIYGLGVEGAVIAGDDAVDLVHPDDQMMLRGDYYEAIQTAGRVHVAFRIVRPDGEHRWVETWGRVQQSPGAPDRLVGVIADITERRRADDRLATLLEAEKQARAKAELAHERLGILSDATERLSATLDPVAVAGVLAEVCVPLLADVCTVDLLAEDGELDEVAARARDERSLADLRELRRRRAALDGVGGVWSERRVAGRAESVWISEITDEQNRAAAADEEHLALIRRFGARSSVVVPLVARDRVLGVLTVLYNVTDRRYDAEQLALVEEIGARAALALDNGRLFASRARVARSLQEALLPPALPSVAWLDLAARYRVADADVEIGGDFYDVMEVEEGAWGVVVGDVCGRGPDAAALTGLMRHSVRAAALRQRRPSAVLARTNDAVLDQIDDARFCTAAYLRVDGGEGEPVRVRASSAGHPRPALLRADGRAELIDCGGVLLGVVADPQLTDAELVLGPGDAIVLYTDGVTEARRGRHQFGDDGLLRTLANLAGKDAEGIAEGLDRAVHDHQDGATDDLAIVVVRAPDGGAG